MGSWRRKHGAKSRLATAEIYFPGFFFSQIEKKAKKHSIPSLLILFIDRPGLSFLLESVGLPILKDTSLDLLRP